MYNEKSMRTFLDDSNLLSDNTFYLNSDGMKFVVNTTNYYRHS